MTWKKKKASSETFNISDNILARAAGIIGDVRQNHALEHATIAILLKQIDGKVSLLGRAGINCFYLYGDVPTKAIEKAANEALRRLNEGDEELAISPMCGTNLVMTGLTASIASMIASKGHKGWSKFSRMAQASMMAALVSQPLGRLAQKHVTTNADITGIRSVEITKTGKGKFTQHRIKIIR